MPRASRHVRNGVQGDGPARVQADEPRANGARLQVIGQMVGGVEVLPSGRFRILRGREHNAPVADPLDFELAASGPTSSKYTLSDETREIANPLVNWQLVTADFALYLVEVGAPRDRKAVHLKACHDIGRARA